MTSSEEHAQIAARLSAVRSQIDAACQRAGRDPATVTLVAVSKTVSFGACQAAVDAKQALLGENYAQELRDKARQVRGARWHFIGPLQRNKVKYVVGVAELIHSVDTPALVDEIGRHSEKIGTIQRCLIQVNLAAESQKAGCLPDELPTLLGATCAHASVRCDGLMCIPPADRDPVPYFRQLRRLAEQHQLPTLSMGMSGDFEAAIAEGATIVRVGSAIFGARA